MRLLFNLSRHPLLGFVPTAFAVQTDDVGQMTYAVAKVYAHTLESHSIELDDVRKKLFALMDSFSEEAIELKFNTSGKRKKVLAKLWEEEVSKQAIQLHLERQLDSFLRLLKAQGEPIGLELYRKAYVEDLVLRFAPESPQPNLYFKKTEEGVFYKLRFQENGKLWNISERPSEVLVNNPAWVMFDRTLYQISDINGNMIKPFQKQDEVFIADRFVADYFRKFILRVAAKAEIEAEGFTLTVSEELEKAELEISEDPFLHRAGLTLYFNYGGERFPYLDKTPIRTRLFFEEDGAIALRQYRRNRDLEAERAERLVAMGLENEGNAFFYLEGAENGMAFLPWLAEFRGALEKAGFVLENPRLGDKRVKLDRPVQRLSLRQDGDWFDVYGDILVGDTVFAFVKLAPYIRSGDRFYPISEGLYFVIPEEWMQRFGPLFQLAKASAMGARIAKSQYTLLENIPIESTVRLPDPNAEATPFYLPDDMNAELRPYQEEGLRWLFGLYCNGLGGCLADDMGLGKTLQSIAMLLLARREKTVREAHLEAEQRAAQQLNLFTEFVASRGGIPPLHALVILPASLVFNWRRELERFAPQLQVCVHTGPKRARSELSLRGFDVVLTTYHTLLKDISFLKKIYYEYVILDEAQQIKNKDSKLYSAVNEIEAHNKLSLSGTPIENSLSELWAQMQFINPGLLGPYANFKRHYQVPIEKHRDADRILALRKLIAPYLLRRTKSAVEKDLPELTRQVYYSEMTESQRKRYEREKSAVRNYILENYRTGDGPFRIQVLSALTRLRQLANHPALLKTPTLGDAEPENDPLPETIDSGKFGDIVHNLDVIHRSGHKALLFSQFVQHLELFRAWLREREIPFAWLTGDSSATERENAVDAFENDPNVSFLLISLKAGGTGLNLTAADYVIIADPWWNPASEEQAIARAHRIGQTKKVVAIKFIAKDSIEEKILALQDKKRQIAADFVDQQGGLPMEKEDLVFLVS